jgi:hypothetical protein
MANIVYPNVGYIKSADNTGIVFYTELRVKNNGIWFNVMKSEFFENTNDATEHIEPNDFIAPLKEKFKQDFSEAEIFLISQDSSSDQSDYPVAFDDLQISFTNLLLE